MGFSFLAPLFFAGLIALAVPVIIHLTHRTRSEVEPFPSLMFLSRIPFRTTRRQRIRHWLLFALRCAAVVLLVAAFARPVLDSADAAAGADAAARERVILLDRSYSMGYGDRWDRAIAAARRAVTSLDRDDRATLITFAERAEAVGQATADRSALLARIGEARPGSGVTRYAPAFELAAELLARSERPRREVTLITDFQKSGWDPRSTVRLPQGTVLTHVDVGEGEPAAVNVAVADVILERTSAAGGRAEVLARLANTGSEDAADLEVALELGGQVAATVTAAVEARTSATVRFRPVPIPDRPVRGLVRVPPDPLARDNVFRFVASPRAAVSVLIVEPQGAGPEHGLYLRRALSTASRPELRTTVRPLAGLSQRDLANADVVILNDAPVTGAAAARRLRNWVADGGGLLAVLGRRSAVSDRAPEQLLPAIAPEPVDRSDDGGGTLAFIDYDHPVFEVFATPRSGDFSSSRFFRYLRPVETGDGPDLDVLARFDDGTIALAERRQGGGRVLTWTSDLENFWNDLAVQPVFLPFLHRAIRHLSGYVERPPAYTVGAVVDLARIWPDWPDEPVLGGEEWVLETPNGDRSLLRPAEGPRLIELDREGFYGVRRMEEGTDAFSLAANPDVAESDLTVMDPDELTATVMGGTAAAGGAFGPTVLGAEERERRQSLWWYLLAALGLLLVGETVLSNRRPSIARARSR